MAELTISSDEIRSAIANYTSSYSAEACLLYTSDAADDCCRV